MDGCCHRWVHVGHKHLRLWLVVMVVVVVLLLLLLRLPQTQSVKDGGWWPQPVVMLLTSAGVLCNSLSVEDGRWCWGAVLLRTSAGELYDLEGVEGGCWWWLKQWLHRNGRHSMLGLAWR